MKYDDGKDIERFLYETIKPKPEYREFRVEATLGEDLSVIIERRFNTVKPGNTNDVRVVERKSLFISMAFKELVFTRIMDEAIIFLEIINAFLSNMLNAKGKDGTKIQYTVSRETQFFIVNIGVRVVFKDGVPYLAIYPLKDDIEEETRFFNKVSCKVISYKLGRILGQCQYP